MENKDKLNFRVDKEKYDEKSWTVREWLGAVTGRSKAKEKRSEAKGGNLTADGWPWLYSTQPALGPAQRVNVERSLTSRELDSRASYIPSTYGYTYSLQIVRVLKRHRLYEILFSPKLIIKRKKKK